ncbi:hypothetical protein C8R43DRAFT_1144026 [Mycena crocata]|nr:hypothetical protein C8R43DRAFT_1144026 [Mycena crocata]
MGSLAPGNIMAARKYYGAAEVIMPPDGILAVWRIWRCQGRVSTRLTRSAPVPVRPRSQLDSALPPLPGFLARCRRPGTCWLRADATEREFKTRGAVNETRPRKKYLHQCGGQRSGIENQWCLKDYQTGSSPDRSEYCFHTSRALAPLMTREIPSLHIMLTITQLGEDVLVQVLSLCDIASVLQISEVNRSLHNVTTVKQLWLRQIRNLQALSLIELPPGVSLQNHTTAELIELVKSILAGPSTLTHGLSPPTARGNQH